MKKVLLPLVALVVLMAPAVYADPIGDVTAPCGKPALSVGYFYENQKLELKDSDVRAKFRSHQMYGEGAFGLAQGWDAFLRFGGATAKVEIGDNATFKDDLTPYGSVGIRGTLPITKGFAIGPFAKFNYYGDWKDTIYGEDVKVKDNWDVMAGLTGKITIEKMVFYGGPFYYYTYSKVTAGGESDKMKTNRNIGALLGMKVPVTAKISLNAEGQYKSDRVSGGVFASYLF